MKQPMKLIILGPCLSIRNPTIGPSRPPSILAIEAAPEVIALDQPNSEVIGLRNTPKPYTNKL